MEERQIIATKYYYCFFIQDHAYSEFIGSVEINTVELLQGSEKDGWFPIKKKSNGKIKGQLNIRVLFISRQQMEKVCYIKVKYILYRYLCL